MTYAISYGDGVREIVGLVMEVDKVANEVTNMGKHGKEILL